MSAESHSKMGHIQSLKTYLFVWVFLLIMTGVTVGAYFLHIESPFLRLVVAMIIAAIKCTAVILYFMHGKYEGKIIWAFIYYPLILLGTLVLFLYVDYGNREPGINVNDYAALQSQYKGTFENYKAHKKGGGSHGEDSHDGGAAVDHGDDRSGAADHGDASTGSEADSSDGSSADAAAAEAAAADAAAADAEADGSETDATNDTSADAEAQGSEADSSDGTSADAAAADAAAADAAAADAAAAEAEADGSETDTANYTPADASEQNTDVSSTTSDSNGATASSGWGDLPGDPEAGKAKAKMLCIACHVIDGAGNKLPQAPPFEESANLERITPEYLYKWMDDPQSIKPGTLMPDLALSDEDIQNLIAFLATYKND